MDAPHNDRALGSSRSFARHTPTSRVVSNANQGEPTDNPPPHLPRLPSLDNWHSTAPLPTQAVGYISPLSNSTQWPDSYQVPGAPAASQATQLSPAFARGTRPDPTSALVTQHVARSVTNPDQVQSDAKMCFSERGSRRPELQPRPVMSSSNRYYPSQAPYSKSLTSRSSSSVASSIYSSKGSSGISGEHSSAEKSSVPVSKRIAQGATHSTPKPPVKTLPPNLIPNLIGEDKAHLVQNLRFSLRIRQQPQHARSCGFADKDRRSIDPPPVVELLIAGEGLSGAEIETYKRHSYIMSCSILDPNGNDATWMDFDGGRTTRRFMGEYTAGNTFARDDNGVPGCFFCFNDLSVRTPGDFRLSFTTIIMPKGRPSTQPRTPRVGDIISDVFRSYNAKTFPGMTASTPLARALRDQGCNISVRKGNEKGGNAGNDDDPDDNAEE